MTDMTNRQYFLASRPGAMPTADNVQCRDVPLRRPGRRRGDAAQSLYFPGPGDPRLDGR